MANIIKHQGIVENINGSHLLVRIVQTSACAGCHAKGHCSSSDSKEKLIEIIESGHIRRVGDSVTIYGKTSMGVLAVIIAFVLPFFVFVIALFSSMALSGGDELFSAFLSFALLIPYYVGVHLCKDKLKTKFSFTLKPIK